MDKEKNNSDMMRVHKSFKERVDNFIDEFMKKVGIKISTTQATKIIDEKIEKKGGLKVTA